MTTKPYAIQPEESVTCGKSSELTAKPPVISAGMSGVYVTQGKFLSEATFYINTTPQESFGALIKGLLFLNLIGNSSTNILLKEMTMIKVTRFGVSMDTNLLRRFDEHIKKRGYSNRSESFR